MLTMLALCPPAVVTTIAAEVAPAEIVATGPSGADDAWFQGFGHGLDCYDRPALPPAHLAPAEREAWFGGWNAGKAEVDAERMEWSDRMDRDSWERDGDRWDFEAELSEVGCRTGLASEGA